MSERFDRQIKTANFSADTQKRLENSTFLIIGVGALGSTTSEMLARSGAGHLVICDMDVVSLSNLHRQSLFDEQDSSNYELKVEAIKHHIARINSNVKITTIAKEIGTHNIEEILKQYQPNIVLDGTDNFSTRYIINDACHKHRIPWVYGACLGNNGTVYGIDNSTCLRCILPEVPDTGQDCAISGIMPQTAHLVASMQVAEVMRYMHDEQFSGKLITFDSYKMQFNHKNIDFLKNNNCKTCGTQSYPALQKVNSIVTKMCRGKYTTGLSPALFDQIKSPVKLQNEHFKLIEFNQHRIHLLKNGRVILFDVYSVEEANKIIDELVNHI